MSAGCHVAPRTGVAFLNLAGSKDLLFLDDDHAGLIPPLIILPDAGCKIFNGVHEIFGTVITDFAVRPLRRVADYREGRIEDQI